MIRLSMLIRLTVSAFLLIFSITSLSRSLNSQPIGLLGQLMSVVNASTAPVSTNLPPDRIDSFDSNIFITHTSTAQITETIIYTNESPHHGLERFIPIVLRDTGSGDSYYFKFKLLSAQNEHGQSYQVSRHDEMKTVGLRIGDPNKTFTGSATYVIKYELSPVVSLQGDSAFLNLNITGNDWRLPIMNTRAQIRIENNPAWNNIKCYTGEVGSMAQQCGVSQLAGGYSFSSLASIQPGEGMTVNANFSPDVFINTLKPNSPPLEWLWQWVLGWLVAAVILVAAIIIRIIRQLAYWRHKKDQIVVAQYEAPDGLKPAEIGLLSDNSVALQEISATLIDLAIRKYIRIDQIRAKTFWQPAQYKLVRLNDKLVGLEDFEQTLIEGIFTDAEKNEEGFSTVQIDKLNQQKMSILFDKIKAMLNQRLEKAGYYPAKQKFVTVVKDWWGKSPVLKAFWLGLLISLVIVPVMVAALSGQFMPLLWIAGAVVGSLFIVNFRKPTAKGVGEWAKVEGFELFLTVTEKDRLKFSDAPEKNPKLFSKMLPYAIALKVERQWTEQFKNIDIGSEAYWYRSNGGTLDSAMFAASISDVSSSFSSSVSAGFSAGSSGGAGGGAGGGGGGGW